VKISFRFPATLASEDTRARRRRSLMLAVVGITVLPLAWRGSSCGQDFDFHLQNWLEVARSWRQGVVNPHWAASANFLAGEPRFVFYPPLSRFLGAALGCVLPWSWTPLAFALVALLGAAWSFRAMAREWVGDDNAAVAACLYVVNPYMMFVLYERGALAELLAAIWVPLLVLYGLRLGNASEIASGVRLALVIAALWLTNAPAAVMSCYLLALIVAVAGLQARSWRLVGRAAWAVPLGLALAGFWLVPAIYEQRWVQIDQAIGPLMRVEDSFLFGYPRPPAGANSDDLFDLNYHNHVLQTASWIVVALLLASAVAAWRARRRKSAVWVPLVIAGAGIAALQFRWSDFLWQAVPKLAFLQFPWRWMLVLGMIFAFLAGLALPAEIPTRRTVAVRALVLLALAGSMAGLAAARFWQPCDEDDNVAAQVQTFQQEGFPGTDEYTLQGVDLDAEGGISGQDGATGPATVMSRMEANSGGAGTGPGKRQIAAHVQVDRWQTEHMTVDVTSPEPGFAVLRLMDYPAWRVTRNGSVAAGVRRNEDGWMAIPVEAGENRIDVRWRTTGDTWAGIGLSLGAVAITLALIWAAGRKLQPDLART
jgi:hypothetical protein